METNIRNKCKAYTSLEQSKKLAEILPLKSADMHYVLIDTESELYSAGLGEYIGILPHYPCWSLTSLMESITKIQQGVIFYNLTYDFILSKWTMNIEADHWRGDVGLYDDQVDACYELILKLHELKML